MASGASRVSLLAVALTSLLLTAPAACVFDDDAAGGGGPTGDTGSNGSSGDVPVVVPDVVGMKVVEARARLNDAGLIPAAEETYSDEDPQGTVLSQAPEAGSEVEGGSVVVLHVADPGCSTGCAFVIVPEVLGMKMAKAKARLNDAGLVSDTSARRYSNWPQGTVVSQKPKAGSEVEGGSVVALALATPFPLIPDVEGLKVKKAKGLLHWRGFVPEVVGRQFSATVAKGKVVSQRPAGGNQGRLGRVVDLVISKGPPPNG